MTVDDDCSCECFPPQSSFELAADQPGIAEPRTPAAPGPQSPVTIAPPLPPPPPPPTIVIIDRPIGPQTNPNIGNLVLTCPGNQSVSTFNIAGTVVNFPAPTATTSQVCSPVSISVNPPSGSFFPLGNTVVNVVATDRCGRTASCSFLVTVNRETCPPVSSFPTINLPGGGTSRLAFDAARQLLYCADQTNGVLYVVDTNAQAYIRTIAGNNGHPHGNFTLAFDAAHDILVVTDQFPNWVGIDPAIGVWNTTVALTPGGDAGNIWEMCMDSTSGIAFYSGISNGSNGAVQIVQYGPGPVATSIYSSGYTQPILGEIGCFAPTANKFMVSNLSGTGAPIFYFDKLGNRTSSLMTIPNIFGSLRSADGSGIVVGQSAGKYCFINPATDTLVNVSSVTSGFLLRAAGYNSCTNKIYVSDDVNTDVFDGTTFAHLQTIALAATDFAFDPFSGYVYALTSTNVVTTL